MLCAPPACTLPPKPQKKTPFAAKGGLSNNHLYHSPNHLYRSLKENNNGYIHITAAQFIQGLC
jgi:hypothetical protein